MSTHGPRPSVLNLFDPLNTDLDASSPSRDLLSPDADKENTPINQFRGNLNDNELTLTAFFNRTYSKKNQQKPIPNPVLLRRRLVDVGDATVIQEESADAEEGDDETAEFNLNETDHEYSDNDDTPSDTPRQKPMIAKSPSPRTPLGELPLDHTRADVFFTPVARKKVKALMLEAQTHTVALATTTEAYSIEESQNSQEGSEEDETISIAYVLNNSPHQVDILRGVPSPIVAHAEGDQTPPSELELAVEEDEAIEPQPKLYIQKHPSTPAIIISVSPSPSDVNDIQIHFDEPKHPIKCNVDVVTASQSHPLPPSVNPKVHSSPIAASLLSPPTATRSNLSPAPPNNPASLSLSSSFKLGDPLTSFDILNAKISCSYGSSYGGGSDNLAVSTLEERQQSTTLAPPAFDRKKRSERANARDSVDLSSSFQISDLGKDGSFDLLNDKISFFSSRSRGGRSALDDEDYEGNGSFDLQEEEDRMDFLVGSMVSRREEQDEKVEKVEEKDEDDLSTHFRFIFALGKRT